MPSLIQPLLHTPAPPCHPPHLAPALSKSHSQQLPSSRCIESAHALPCDPRFLAGGASDTALGLMARVNGSPSWPIRSEVARDSGINFSGQPRCPSRSNSSQLG